MNWYQNKRIVITGATSGIGKLLLLELEERGAFVVAAGRDISRVEASPRVFPYACDISHAGNVDGLFRYATDVMGGIDVFFANAGFGYYERFRAAGWEHIDHIFRTNVYSPLYALGKMMELCGEKEFSYIITCSGVAQTPLAGFSLYTSTKFAIDGFSQAVRLELPRNVHLTTVYPVAMKTGFFPRSGERAVLPIFRQRPETAVKKMLRAIPRHKRYVRPMPLFNLTVWFIRVFPFIGRFGLWVSARKVR